MKKLLLISILFFNTDLLKATDNFLIENNVDFKINCGDTTTYPVSKLMAIDGSSYLNRPINDFLGYLDVAAPGYLLSRVYGLHSMRLATRINVYYNNGLNFTIVVKEFQHMEQFNADSKWDINLFRQEKAYSIELHNMGLCVSGCLPE